MRVLIVDDSRAIRSMIGRMMRELGFETYEAEHGIEALQRLAPDPLPDLILSDWNMPEMDGLTLLKTLRANDRYAGVRIIMVTTETDMTQVMQALEAGADEYIMKPFTADVIREKLELLQLTVS